MNKGNDRGRECREVQGTRTQANRAMIETKSGVGNFCFYDARKSSRTSFEAKDPLENHRVHCAKHPANKVKILSKNRFENCCVHVRNKLVDKFEAGDKEKDVQDASGWLDESRLAKKDEFEVKQKRLRVVGQMVDMYCGDQKTGPHRSGHTWNGHAVAERQQQTTT